MMVTFAMEIPADADVAAAELDLRADVEHWVTAARQPCGPVVVRQADGYTFTPDPLHPTKVIHLEARVEVLR